MNSPTRRLAVYADLSGIPSHYLYQCRVCGQTYDRLALLNDHPCARDTEPATYEAEVRAAHAQLRVLLALIERLAMTPGYRMTGGDLRELRDACRVCGVEIPDYLQTGE